MSAGYDESKLLKQWAKEKHELKKKGNKKGEK